MCVISWNTAGPDILWPEKAVSVVVELPGAEVEVHRVVDERRRRIMRMVETYRHGPDRLHAFFAT